MSYKIMKKSVMLGFLVVLLLPGRTCVLSNSLSIPAVSTQNSTSDIPSSAFATILIDSVELFRPPETTLSLTLNFTQGWIYYVSVESYTPFTTAMTLDIFCTSPLEKLYHFMDYSVQLNNNITEFYFEYGAAESGNHTIDFVVGVTENTNLHIYVEEYLSLEEYFDRFTVLSVDEDILYFTDIYRFTSSRTSKSYTLPMQEDTEYRVNFFRVNPLSQSDQDQEAFENPAVTLDLTLGGTTFAFYPTIPTLDYALYNNLGQILMGTIPEGRIFANNSYNVRFGAHASGNATLDFLLSEGFPFNLNFAVVVFAVKEIGNGPDDITNGTSGGVNDTDPWLPDNSTLVNDAASWWSDWINARTEKIGNFLSAQFPWFLIGIVTLLGGSAGYLQYKKWKEAKQPANPSNAEQYAK